MQRIDWVIPGHYVSLWDYLIYFIMGHSWPTWCTWGRVLVYILCQKLCSEWYQCMEKWKTIDLAFCYCFIGTLVHLYISYFYFGLKFNFDFNPRISVYLCFASIARFNQFTSNQVALRLRVSGANLSLFGMVCQTCVYI